MKTGSELIAAERARQISVEGWTPDHDEKHSRGELTDAAMCYNLAADGMVQRGWTVEQAKAEMLAFCWPWEPEWCKPAPTAIRNYVKAGALIAAEIDRLQRLGVGFEQGGPVDPAKTYLSFIGGLPPHMVSTDFEVARRPA